jgi:hypothetical protein
MPISDTADPIEIPRRAGRRRRWYQLLATVAVVCLALFASEIVAGVQHSATSLVWFLYSVDPGPALASPGSHWQARRLDEGYGVTGSWTKVEVSPVGSAGWREVGGSYSWDATLRWATATTLLVNDEGTRHTIDVPPAYRQAAPGIGDRLSAALYKPASAGLAPLTGIAILAVGLLCVFAIPASLDRIAVKRLAREVLDCLRGGDTWAAVALTWTDEPALRAHATQLAQTLRESELARLCRSHHRSRVSVLSRLRRGSAHGVAYVVSVQFPQEAEHAATRRDLVVVSTDAGWRLRLSAE